ncbi:MAG TPA: fumarylacetoacetate hydrolase family protein [Kofleriaceae bacterium]|nr:fumarylacetoacetate hydrolase family protein [Kofleriaceae bacterium]
MARDLDGPMWREQRPWFEIWFAVVLDDSRRRALWVRQTLFVPRQGDGRASVWGAWFDADAVPRTRAGKRREGFGAMKLADGDALIRIADSWFARGGAHGAACGLAWDARWSGGRAPSDDAPAWLPAPTHARTFAHDANAEAAVELDGATRALRGRAFAMHLWGRRRVPTLQWIWAPWLGESSLEVTAISLRDRFALGLSSLALDGKTRELAGAPATAAHEHGLVTATLAGARKLVHARAWAEPGDMVGYAYRDTDDRDLMVAQSDIGSAHLEVFTRAAPGMPWKPADERRSAGGVAVEIHQRTPLPEVSYIAWDELARRAAPVAAPAPRADQVEWPELGAIVALGLTYRDHVRETGQDAPPAPITFAKHARAFVLGDATVPVPDSAALIAELEALEPGLGRELARRLPFVPAVMDYEGELALVALGPIDDERLAAGVAQPFGLAACNDLTARICQVLGEGTARPYDYWACAKSFARFLPVAPRVWAPPGGLQAIPELAIETRVNGELRQRGSTRDLVYDLPQIARAARASLGRPLARGDVIATGTPAGVGLRLGAIARRVAAYVKDRYRKAELMVASYATSSALLRPGDVIEVDVGLAGRVRARLTV